MDPVLPIFLGIAVQEQVAELRSYLNSLGASLEDEGPANLDENLAQLFSVCSNCLKSCSEAEVQGFLNSLLSLIIALTEKRNEVICKFVEMLVDMLPHPCVRHQVMNVLFCGLSELDPVRFDIYCGQLQLVLKSGMIDQVTTDLNQVKLLLERWNDVEKSRKIYQLLHDALVANEQSENASKVMVELLRTYPEDSGDQAKDHAMNCIKSHVNRPDVWVMDHLMELGPVKCLKGELMYQILEIFVSGNIHDYIKFYEENSNFIESAGFDHERNMQKMRILTFISLVNKHDEITFEELSKELSINIDDVDSFIINVLKTRLVRVRIDQVGGKVITSSAAHRTFNKPQWELLQQKLKEWQKNLHTVRKQLSDLEVM